MKHLKKNKKDTVLSYLVNINQLFSIFKRKGRYFFTYLFYLPHFSKILLSSPIKVKLLSVFNYFLIFSRFSKKANIKVIFPSKTAKIHQKVRTFLRSFSVDKLWYNFKFNQIMSLIMFTIYFLEQIDRCLTNSHISTPAKYTYLKLLLKFKNFQSHFIRKQDLCSYLSLTEKAVQNHLKELEDADLITRNYDTTSNGERKVGYSLQIQLILPPQFLLIEAA